MGQLVETLCDILRDGVTLEELAIVSVLTAGVVLCVYALSQAAVKIVECVSNGILGIFGTSVHAISEGIRNGGKSLLSTLSTKETDNGPPKGKTY